MYCFLDVGSSLYERTEVTCAESLSVVMLERLIDQRDAGRLVCVAGTNLPLIECEYVVLKYPTGRERAFAITRRAFASKRRAFAIRCVAFANSRKASRVDAGLSQLHGF